MLNFPERLAQAMIRAGYNKKPQAWYEGKILDDITSQLEQSKFATEINIHPTLLNRHLKGKQPPHIDDLILYAKNLDVTVDWLLSITDTLPEPFPRKLVSCENDGEDLYDVMKQASKAIELEQIGIYLENARKIFCLASTDQHGKPIEEVNFLVKLFYLDYLFFLLTISSASSPVKPEFFQNNIQRNLSILNYLFILLPHDLNDWVDNDLQVYIVYLLQLEIKPNTRQSIENLFCITSLAFSWLIHVQSFHMILALKSNGTQVVIDLVNNVIKEHTLPLKPIRYSTTQNQQQLHNIRQQIRALIDAHIG
jgi:transcriptional regulator with XRE-family HTH domain